jgi:MoaA/NifB/PqqE/SkfB family radical SAM enzyme
MPNILLNNYCNRQCPYCFARQRLQQDDGRSRNLSMAELEHIIRFFRQSDIEEFSLLGGEPTLHPEFERLAQKVLDEGFSLTLFTNGLMPSGVLSYLAGVDKERLNMVVNINRPDATPPAEWERLMHNLKLLGDRAGLGYNIYQSQPEFEFLLEVMDNCKLKKYIRLSMAQPILKADNAYLPLEAYSAMAPQLVDFAQACDGVDIKLAFDCGFILCMFNEEQLGRLYYYNVKLGFYCGPAIDIGPGLEIWYCFPLSHTYNRRLEEFENYQQITDFYYQKFTPFRLFGSLPRCTHCKYRRRGQCSGGCLSHKMRAFHM